MKKLYINCPFKDKDDAKKLGALWDSNKKLWYAPSYDIFQNLSKWYFKIHQPNPYISKYTNYSKYSNYTKYPNIRPKPSQKYDGKLFTSFDTRGD